jgi:hypothetical protein
MWMDEAQCMIALFHKTLALSPFLSGSPWSSSSLPSAYPPNPQSHSNKEDALGNVICITGSKISCALVEKSHVLSHL